MNTPTQPPRIYGPFRPFNARGLPIAMKGILPAWMARQPEKMKGPQQ